MLGFYLVEIDKLIPNITWKSKNTKVEKKTFEKVLVEINMILATYVNKESLVYIDEENLQNIKFDLIDLDTETKSLKSYFAEWSLLWLEAIISLRMSEIKTGGVNNGR